MTSATPVAVLGAGSWGTALAARLAENGVPTTLWGRTPQAVVDMATARRNTRYLPDLLLPESLQISGAIEPCVRDAGTLLIAVPSHILVRQRNDCCAPFATFWAITVGFSVMLLSFGPGVFFLFAKRIRSLKAKNPGNPPLIDIRP